MSCKNKKNNKKNNNKANSLLVETVKKEAATPAHIQDNNKKDM